MLLQHSVQDALFNKIKGKTSKKKKASGTNFAKLKNSTVSILESLFNFFLLSDTSCINFSHNHSKTVMSVILMFLYFILRYQSRKKTLEHIELSLSVRNYSNAVNNDVNAAAAAVSNSNGGGGDNDDFIYDGGESHES